LYNGSVYEEFFGLAEAHRLNAEGLTHTIVSLVNKLSVLSGNCILLRNCIGQDYDGASVVAGHLSGVNVLIRQNYTSCAQYIHGFNHKLNLVHVGVVKSISCCAETLSLLQSFYVFLRGSAVHKLWVLLQTDKGLSVVELKSISETRWACQANMISAFCSRLEIFLILVQQIIDCDSDSATVVAARGYLCQVDRTFVRYLFIVKYILTSAKSVSDFLQRPGYCLADAISVVESFELTLQEIRSADKCHVFLNATDSACESVDIVERVIRRPRKLNSRLAGTLVDASVEADNAHSFQIFKRNIFAVIDKMLCEINRRFSTCNKKTITEFTCEYSSLLTADCLEARSS
jgi:hypothetical protein